MSNTEYVIKYDPENVTCEIDGETWVPERTCTIQLVADGKVRLSCGHAIKELAFTPYLRGLNFCPRCGAKVVDK